MKRSMVTLLTLSVCALFVASFARAAEPAKFDRVVLLDVQGLFGGRNVWVSHDGTGWCKIVRRPKPGETGLMEMLYRVKLSQDETAALAELVRAHDVSSIRMRDRSGVPDEGRPAIYLSADGKEAAVEKWANDKNDDFDAIYASLVKIADAAKETEQVRWGPYQAGWTPEGFPDAAKIHALAAAQKGRAHGRNAEESGKARVPALIKSLGGIRPVAGQAIPELERLAARTGRNSSASTRPTNQYVVTRRFGTGLFP